MSRKTCEYPECTNHVFSKGRCRWHQIRKPIRPMSDKRKAQMPAYSRKKKAFLTANPLCQMCPKNTDTPPKPNRSTDIHHKYRRVGDAFLDENTWIAACRPCHKKTEDDPDWAYEHQFMATEQEKRDYYGY